MTPGGFGLCHAGRRILAGADGQNPVRCADGFLSGGAFGHHWHLLLICSRQHSDFKTAAPKQKLLLSAEKFYFCFRYDVPHETKCCGPFQYLYSFHLCPGHPFLYCQPVYWRGGHFTRPLSKADHNQLCGGDPPKRRTVGAGLPPPCKRLWNIGPKQCGLCQFQLSGPL